MPDSNGFFRFLWRVNAVLLTLCGLGVLLILGGFAVSAVLWRGYTPPAPPHEAAVADKETPDAVYNFGTNDMAFGDTGSLSALEGTSEAMMVLSRQWRGGGAGSLSERGYSVVNVNVLIVDAATARTRWLFAGVKRFIGTGYKVHAAAPDGRIGDSVVVAVLLPVAEADSNHDGTIDAGDDQSLYVYRPGDARAAKLLAAKAISNIRQANAGRVLVTYYDGKNDKIAIFETPGFKPIAQNVISTTPK